MRTSIINADKAKKYRIFYKIVAAAVWIMVWQLTSMYLKQEILLASPVSVIETYRIDCNGRFLEICGIQFRKDYTGIFSGFAPGNSSGGTFFCFFCCGSADGAIDHGDKSYAGCFFYYFVPDLDSIQKLIRVYFVSHGFSSGIYKYSGRNQADGQTASGDGRFLWRGSGKKITIYLSFPGYAICSYCL